MSVELKDLKIGDKVIYQRKSDGPERIKKIVRITNTMIIIDDELRFSRSDGFIKGGCSWDYSRIYVATDDKIKSILDKQHRDGLIRQIKGQCWDDLSIEIIEEISGILNS